MATSTPAQAGPADAMFVSQERVLPVSFAAASARLAGLPGGGWFREASQAVYQDGVAYLMRVGPAGAVPGVSRLVRVQFTEPAVRDGVTTIGLRWEAAGVTGGLFPALDADIRITDEDQAGEDAVRVTLTGSYRPPLGALGAGLDRLVLHTVATATVHTLLDRLAVALEGAPTQAGPLAAPWRPEPGLGAADTPDPCGA
jgi:hypothetical protein